MTSACILGCAGLELGADEAALFREVRPWGFILFARNVAEPDQVRHLVDALRETVERPDAPVMIDQEGGRVQRLGPPHWRRYPPAAAYARLGADMAWLGGRLIAHDLASLGINVDCAPVLDLPAPDGHAIIGDRAFGTEREAAEALARAMAEGLLAGGVLPVVKHVPGHGRATADSHLELPRVDASLVDLSARDFAPFRRMADMPIAMTAHVVYSAIDLERPATTSRAVIDAIRREIGFDGLLLSDDLEMKALSGSLAERARAARDAGCDIVLQCHGEVADLRAVAEAAGVLAGEPARRADAALACLRQPAPFDAEAEGARFDAVVATLR